jgi:hypothetical protein
MTITTITTTNKMAPALPLTAEGLSQMEEPNERHTA